VSVRGGGGGGVIAGTGTAQGVVSFANSNGVTFGVSGGTLTATVNPGPAAGIGGVIAGTQTLTSQSVSFVNSNNISFGLSNSSNLTASFQPGVSAVSAGTQNATSGQVVFSNSNNMSFGLSNSSIVTASFSDTANIGTNTTFAGTNVSGSITINTAGLNLALSAAAGGGGGGTLSAFLLGNTLTGNSTSSSINEVSYSVRGLNAAYVGLSAGTLQVGVPNYFAGVSNIGNTSGNTGIQSLQMVLAGGANITLSVSTQTANNGLYGTCTVQTITISGGAGGGANTLTVYGTGNTTQSTSGTMPLSSLVVSGDGIVSAGMTGNTLVISAPQSAAFTSFSGGVSTGGNTSGNTGVVTGQLVLAGGNNVTLSGSTNAGSMTVTISAGAGGAANSMTGYWLGNSLTPFTSSGTLALSSVVVQGSSATNNNNALYGGISNGSLQLGVPPLFIGVFNIGNTSGNTGLQSGQAVFAGGNNITLSVSTQTAANGIFGTQTYQTITISAGAGGGAGTNTYFATGNTVSSSSGTIAQSSMIVNALGGVSAGISNGSLLISAPATSSISGASGITVQTNASTISVGLAPASVFAVGNTTQTSSNSVNLSSFSISGAGQVSVGLSNGSIVISALPPQLSMFQALAMDNVFTLTTSNQSSNGVIGVAPISNPYPFTATRADMFVTVSVSSSSNSSCSANFSFYVGLYTRNASTLSLATSGSQSYAMQNTSNNSFGSLTGARRISVPINVNYTGGDVWYAVMSNTTFTNANWITLCGMGAQFGSNYGLLGAATTTTVQMLPGMGSWSTTSAALPGSMAFSHLTGLSPSFTVSLLNFHNFTA